MYGDKLTIKRSVYLAMEKKMFRKVEYILVNREKYSTFIFSADIRSAQIQGTHHLVISFRLSIPNYEGLDFGNLILY